MTKKNAMLTIYSIMLVASTLLLAYGVWPLFMSDGRPAEIWLGGVVFCLGVDGVKHYGSSILKTRRGAA